MAHNASGTAVRRRRGFTLVELLVTIGILALLASLLLPMVMRARRNAARMKTEGMLQTLSMGLDAYQQVWGGYPAVDRTITASQPDLDLKPAYMDYGGHALYKGLACRFALRKGSQPYGPFINIDELRVDRTACVIVDPDGNPVLYIPAREPRPNINALVGAPTPKTPGFVADSDATVNGYPLYDHRAVVKPAGTPPAGAKTFITLAHMQIMLGDDGDVAPTAAPAPNGMIDGKEKPATTGPYLLWTAGDDVTFGLSGTGANVKTDDVTNFPIPARYLK